MTFPTYWWQSHGFDLLENVPFSYFHGVHLLHENTNALIGVFPFLLPLLKVLVDSLLHRLHVEAGGADGHRGEGQVGRWLGNVLWGGIRSSKTIEIRR